MDEFLEKKYFRVYEQKKSKSRPNKRWNHLKTSGARAFSVVSQAISKNATICFYFIQTRWVFIVSSYSKNSMNYFFS